MNDKQPTTRRDLMKPVQLLGFAFIAALFAGVVTLVSMGFFQNVDDDQRAQIIVVALLVAGIAFIATVVIIALLILAVDPAQVTRDISRPVLLPEDETAAPDEAAGTDARS